MQLTSKFAVIALALGTVAIVHAADEPTTKPARPMHGPRLVQPYSKMTTLTPEQKEKIAAIHRKSVEDQHAIAEKEDAEIAALLNDAQKAELEQVKDEARTKTKGREADRKAHATTEPAKD